MSMPTFPGQWRLHKEISVFRSLTTEDELAEPAGCKPGTRGISGAEAALIFFGSSISSSSFPSNLAQGFLLLLWLVLVFFVDLLDSLLVLLSRGFTWPMPVLLVVHLTRVL